MLCVCDVIEGIIKVRNTTFFFDGSEEYRILLNDHLIRVTISNTVKLQFTISTQKGGEQQRYKLRINKEKATILMGNKSSESFLQIVT